jgi:hypothetical protein
MFKPLVDPLSGVGVDGHDGVMLPASELELECSPLDESFMPKISIEVPPGACKILQIIRKEKKKRKDFA